MLRFPSSFYASVNELWHADTTGESWDHPISAIFSAVISSHIWHRIIKSNCDGKIQALHVSLGLRCILISSDGLRKVSWSYTALSLNSYLTGRKWSLCHEACLGRWADLPLYFQGFQGSRLKKLAWLGNGVPGPRTTTLVSRSEVAKWAYLHNSCILLHRLLVGIAYKYTP